MANRFKGLDLIQCLKNYEQKIIRLYRRWWSKPSPRKKRMQKGKKVVWGSLTNSWEKKRSKGKGEKERYTHLNEEFQRIARRDKKIFLSDQCKEIEENYRMGKTRDRFKKIRDTKGTFHAKMGTIKDRNCMDLTEAEDIKKKWQEYTENKTKKIFTTRTITVVWLLTYSQTSWNEKSSEP